MSNPKQYTIVASIAEVKDCGIVLLNGAGKYAYSKEEKVRWLVLEGKSPDLSKFLDENTEFVISAQDEIQKTVFAIAMINKKTLKMTIIESEKDEKTIYKIISIKNP